MVDRLQVPSIIRKEPAKEKLRIIFKLKTLKNFSLLFGLITVYGKIDYEILNTAKKRFKSSEVKWSILKCRRWLAYAILM